MHKSITVCIFMILCTVSAGTALAQDKQAVAKKLSDNAQKLREYSFTKRTELRINGQSEMTRLEKVRWDIDGRQQATPTGGSGAAKRALIGGGAGTAVTFAARGNEIELPAEQALGFVTAQPIEVRP